MYHKMLGIISNIIELTNRRPQGKTLKTHYKVFIKLVLGVTSQWPSFCSYIEGGGSNFPAISIGAPMRATCYCTKGQSQMNTL